MNCFVKYQAKEIKMKLLDDSVSVVFSPFLGVEVEFVQLTVDVIGVPIPHSSIVISGAVSLYRPL